jgi:hypothetical protein
MKVARILGLLVAYAAIEVGEQALYFAGDLLDVAEEVGVELGLMFVRWEARRG